MKRKIEENGYVLSISENSFDGVEITDEEYSIILSVIQNAPSAPTGYVYLLKTDLTWELCELPPDPEVPPTPEEILSQLEAIL